MRPCLDENVILDLVEGALDEGSGREVAAHIDECPACRSLVAHAAGDSGALKRGATVGRHVILEAVGAGAMGAVYAAYDPELERKVAIKLLRSDGAESPELRARLLREAQALARLQHPNVITVHDVGSAGDRVYLAMELVEGVTLAAWLSERRGRDEVLRALLQAGEGLAAAHAAGLVHRDFKPDNVLVGRDGRVRVTDFGLARDDGIGGGGPVMSSIAGTPAYMAPEARRGEAATPSSDQYSFCVTLHEALTGARPPARGRPVPAWLRRLLERGLSPMAEARFPSLPALLEALRRGPRARKRALAAAALAAAAVLVFAGARSLPSRARCDGGAAWGDVWGERDRAAVHDAFRRASATSEPAFATVDGVLAGYRAAWIAMHDDACRMRGEQSEALHDLRAACLSRARGSAATLARVLGGIDSVAGAAAALGQLPPVEACGDATALLARVPPPRDAAQRAAVEVVDARLDESRLLCDLGHCDRGLALVRSVEPAVVAAAHAPLEARRLWSLGRALYRTGPLDDAERELHRAAVAAEAVHDDGVLADAWTLLARIAGFRRARPEEGKLWLAYAGAAIERLGGDDNREANRLDLQALLSWSDADEARALIVKERALIERTCKRDCYRLAYCDMGLANLLLDTGRAEESLPLYRDLCSRLEAAFGPDASALPMTNEAIALSYAGRPEEALTLFRRVMDMHHAGDDGFIHHRVAEAQRRLGRPADALAEDRVALATGERFMHADDPALMPSLLGIGNDLLLLGRAREALPPLERAVTIGDKLRQPGELAEFHFALAQALWEAGGDRARARKLAARAAEEARPEAERYGRRFQTQLDDIERWVAAHR